MINFLSERRYIGVNGVNRGEHITLVLSDGVLEQVTINWNSAQYKNFGLELSHHEASALAKAFSNCLSTSGGCILDLETLEIKELGLGTDEFDIGCFGYVVALDRDTMVQVLRVLLFCCKHISEAVKIDISGEDAGANRPAFQRPLYLSNDDRIWLLQDGRTIKLNEDTIGDLTSWSPVSPMFLSTCSDEDAEAVRNWVQRCKASMMQMPF